MIKELIDRSRQPESRTNNKKQQKPKTTKQQKDTHFVQKQQKSQQKDTHFVYDGHVDRHQAERLACLDVLANDGLPPVVHLLLVEMGESTDWVLTTDVESARATLSELGGKHIVEVSVDDTVRRQFGDLAVLGTPPW